jgi:hypothetical protein
MDGNWHYCMFKIAKRREPRLECEKRFACATINLKIILSAIHTLTNASISASINIFCLNRVALRFLITQLERASMPSAELALVLIRFEDFFAILFYGKTSRRDSSPVWMAQIYIQESDKT